MTRGAHRNGARAGAHAGAFVSWGVTISTLTVSGVAVPAVLKAPLAGSSRLKVVIFVSSTSRMFELWTVGSTPYLANAAAGVSTVIGAVGAPAAAGGRRKDPGSRCCRARSRQRAEAR